MSCLPNRYKILVIPGSRLCGDRLDQGCDCWVGGEGDGVVQEDGQQVGEAGTKHRGKLFKIWPPWWFSDPRMNDVEWFGKYEVVQWYEYDHHEQCYTDGYNSQGSW